MGQLSRVSRNNTEVILKEGAGTVVLYRTTIVKWDEKKIILNSGGHQTVTTKARMTQTSNQFRLGFIVRQKGDIWYVGFKGEKMPFRDGMVLNR